MEQTEHSPVAAAIPLAYARPMSDEEREAGAAAMILGDADMSEAAARLRFQSVFKTPAVAAVFYADFQNRRFALGRAHGVCAECGQTAACVVRIRWTVHFAPRFSAFSVASTTRDVYLRTFHPLCERCAAQVTAARRRTLRIIAGGEALTLMAIGSFALYLARRNFTGREAMVVAFALATVTLGAGRWLAQTRGRNPLGPGLRRVICGRLLGLKRVRKSAWWGGLALFFARRKSRWASTPTYSA